jgi:hypothetical protein
MSRWWGSRRATKVLLLAGVASGLIYVVGDLVSAFTRRRATSFVPHLSRGRRLHVTQGNDDRRP